MPQEQASNHVLPITHKETLRQTTFVSPPPCLYKGNNINSALQKVLNFSDARSCKSTESYFCRLMLVRDVFSLKNIQI